MKGEPTFNLMRDEKEYVSQEIINGKAYVVHHYDNGCTSIMGDPQGDLAKRIAEEIVTAQNNNQPPVSSSSTINNVYEEDYIENEEFKYELLQERMEKEQKKIDDYKSWYDNLSDEEKRAEDGRVLKAKEEFDKRQNLPMLKATLTFIFGTIAILLPPILFIIFCLLSL